MFTGVCLSLKRCKGLRSAADSVFTFVPQLHKCTVRSEVPENWSRDDDGNGVKEVSRFLSHLAKTTFNIYYFY